MPLVLSVLLVSIMSSQVFGYNKPSIFEKSSSELKAVVFLSATCPCSKSHVDHLNQLDRKYSNFELYGVITDQGQPSNKKSLDDYYNGSRFKFPVIEDSQQSLVKKYKALKTPHVVLLKKGKSGKYEMIYEGGVSDQRQFDRSKNKFLEENLLALAKKRPLPHKQGRSLGCYIRRF